VNRAEAEHFEPAHAGWGGNGDLVTLLLPDDGLADGELVEISPFVASASSGMTSW